MTWTFTGSPDEYLATAGDFLRSDPVRNTIPLTAAETVRVRGPGAFGEIAPLAGINRPVAGTARVGPVYTPPDHRRLGYGGAVTAP